MSAPEVRILFALGARLHMSAASVEALSMREIAAWVDYFNQGAAGNDEDGAIDVATLSRAQLRAMFGHGHR
jgi:hypothetical protein